MCITVGVYGSVHFASTVLAPLKYLNRNTLPENTQIHTNTHKFVHTHTGSKARRVVRGYGLRYPERSCLFSTAAVSFRTALVHSVLTLETVLNFTRCSSVVIVSLLLMVVASVCGIANVSTIRVISRFIWCV